MFSVTSKTALQHTAKSDELSDLEIQLSSKFDKEVSVSKHITKSLVEDIESMYENLREIVDHTQSVPNLKSISAMDTGREQLLDIIPKILNSAVIFTSSNSNSNFDVERLNPTDTHRLELLLNYFEIAGVKSIEDIAIHDGAKVTIIAKGHNESFKIYPNKTMLNVERNAYNKLEQIGRLDLAVASRQWDTKGLTAIATSLDAGTKVSKQESIEHGFFVNQELEKHGLKMTDLHLGDNVGILKGLKIVFDVKSLVNLDGSALKIELALESEEKQDTKFTFELIKKEMLFSWFNRTKLSKGFDVFVSQNKSDIGDLKNQLIKYKDDLINNLSGFKLVRQESKVQMLIDHLDQNYQ